MVEQMKWLDRTFTFDLPVGWFPAIVERLHGTPARAADLMANVPENVLANRMDGGWSIKEHISHLHDLDALDEVRLHEFLAGAARLSAADMGNRKTESANHNARPAAEIVRAFRLAREALVQKLERLSSDQVAAAAHHPRLDRPLRLIDWAWFVAEHDDHHLARARAILRKLQDA